MSVLADNQKLRREPTAESDAKNPARDEDLDLLRRTRPPTESPHGTQIVDLFASLGGLTYGALEGFRRRGRSGTLKLAVDVDPAPLAVFKATLGGNPDRYQCVDLKQLLRPIAESASAVESQLFGHIRTGKALLLAGPPCQGHSALNNHTRHDDPRNDLYLSVARAARLIEARAVIIENVQTIGSDRRRTVERCVAALQELGYEVAEQRIDLSRIGVPQKRRRHVLVATRGASFKWDVPTRKQRTLSWALADLLDNDTGDYIDTPSKPNAENQARIRWLFDNDAFDLPDDQRPVCHQSEHSYRSMYGRMHWDAPAQTITSGFGSMGQGRYVHPLRPRMITPHEAARLQCLPDYVRLDQERRRSVLAQMIGNAAPPLLSAWIVAGLIGQGLL